MAVLKLTGCGAAATGGRGEGKDQLAVESWIENVFIAPPAGELGELPTKTRVIYLNAVLNDILIFSFFDRFIFWTFSLLNPQ